MRCFFIRRKFRWLIKMYYGCDDLQDAIAKSYFAGRGALDGVKRVERCALN